jgi:hypothetical protein
MFFERRGKSVREKEIEKFSFFVQTFFLSELKENNGRYSTYYVQAFTKKQYFKCTF